MSESAEKLVDTILTGPTIDRPVALFELARQLNGTDRSTERSDFAMEAFGRIAYYTPQFQQFVDGAVQSGIQNVNRSRRKAAKA